MRLLNDFQIGRLERKLARLQAERLEAEAEASINAATSENADQKERPVNPYYRHLLWTFADDPMGLVVAVGRMAAEQDQMAAGLEVLRAVQLP